MKYFTFLCFTFITINTYSQSNHKSLSLEGGGNYVKRLEKVGNSRTENSRFQLNPKIGFYLSDKIMVGISFDYSQFKTKSASISFTPITTFKSKDDVYKYGIFLSSQNIIWKKIALRTDYGINLSHSDGKRDQSTISSYTTRGIEAYATPGLIYFINDQLALSFFFGQLQFVREEQTNKGFNIAQNKRERNEFIFDINPSTLLLSLQFKISTKSKPTTEK